MDAVLWYHNGEEIKAIYHEMVELVNVLDATPKIYFNTMPKY